MLLGHSRSGLYQMQDKVETNEVRKLMFRFSRTMRVCETMYQRILELWHNGSVSYSPSLMLCVRNSLIVVTVGKLKAVPEIV